MRRRSWLSLRDLAQLLDRPEAEVVAALRALGKPAPLPGIRQRFDLGTLTALARVLESAIPESVARR